jgi:hypothetical protein
MENKFNEIGYAVLENAISTETAKLISLEFNMLRDNTFYVNNVDLNSVGFLSDPDKPKTFSWYGAYCCEALLSLLQPKIEAITGKTLYPSYSYARIYYKGSELKRHIDRPGSDYAVTVTIDIDETSDPWYIWMKDFNGVENKLELPVGDACVYHGDKLEHWRLPYNGNKQVQVFLFYVEDETQKFDRRPMLGASVDTKKPETYEFGHTNI